MKKKSFSFKFGTVCIGFVALLSLISCFYTPYDTNVMDTDNRFFAPGMSHILGTDNFGRDILSRLMEGGKFTLIVALSTVLIAGIIGCILGLICGYKGKILDEVIMRIMDALNSFPGILLALVVVTVLQEGKYTIIIALSILFVPNFTRVVRSGTLKYKNSDFIKSARVFGAGDFRIIFFHILPNLYSEILSVTIISLSKAILAESSMSYLGLGIQPPDPSWGRMLSEAQAYLFNAPWCAIAPGIMIMITVIGLNCIAEEIQKKYC